MSYTFTYQTKHVTADPFAEDVCTIINDKIPHGYVSVLPEDTPAMQTDIYTWSCLINGDIVVAQVRGFHLPDDKCRHYGSRNADPTYVAGRILLDLSKRVGEALTGQYVH